MAPGRVRADGVVVIQSRYAAPVRADAPRSPGGRVGAGEKRRGRVRGFPGKGAILYGNGWAGGGVCASGGGVSAPNDETAVCAHPVPGHGMGERARAVFKERRSTKHSGVGKRVSRPRDASARPGASSFKADTPPPPARTRPGPGRRGMRLATRTKTCSLSEMSGRGRSLVRMIFAAVQEGRALVRKRLGWGRGLRKSRPRPWDGGAGGTGPGRASSRPVCF